VIASVRIQELKTGDLAEITSLVGSEHDLSRLSSLGLRGGARVRMLRSGSTCIVELDESQICLRTGAETQIMVQPA
jgi:Fe2+ transport system protein FeoA